jgi:hypothetical protein
MTRKKTGRILADTFAQAVSEEVGEEVISVRSVGKTLGVSPELLVGLAQQGYIKAITRKGDEGKTHWFIAGSEIEALRTLIDKNPS